MSKNSKNLKIKKRSKPKLPKHFFLDINKNNLSFTIYKLTKDGKIIGNLTEYGKPTKDKIAKLVEFMEYNYGNGSDT